MADMKNCLSQISDEKPVRLFLPLIDGEDRLLIQCVLKKESGCHFKLLFPPGTLPVDRIDRNNSCIVSLDVGGQSISLESNIVKVANRQTLEMSVLKSISHDQMREYFRVDCTVPILIRSIVPDAFAEEDDKWKINGTTVDLSGSGLRASLPTAPPSDTQVRLEIALPTTETSIVKALATPVRISQLTGKLWDVAYHFDAIEDEDQDAIIGCCLVAQRRLLRLKVKVTGN